jgi:lipoprotein-anchoring transpeptidase ErfK/SrfK
MKGFIRALGLAAALTLLGNAQSLAATVVARVNLSTQTMTVLHDGFIAYEWKVSTARQGYVTPVGTYRPQRLAQMWYSKKYHHSPMPHSIFFHAGFAIHGTYETSHLGHPASHGCVRLQPANAAILYSMVQEAGPENTTIIVQR